MPNSVSLKSSPSAKMVRAIINAMVEAGEYDLADSFWAFVRAHQGKVPAETRGEAR